MIDWSRVRELCDEIGAENFDEVVDLFLAEVEETLDTLPDCLTQPTVMGERMHALKGSALNLGFSAFAQHCQVGETAAAGGDISRIDPSETRKVYADSRKVFLAELPVQTAVSSGFANP